MPRVVTGFLFALSADSRKFYSAMRQARKGADEVEKAHIRLLTSLHRATRGAREFVKRVVTLRGALTALAGGGAIGAALRSVTDFGAALTEGADRVGLSIEDFQSLQRVFEGDGLAANNFQKAMERLSRTILDANQGLSTATRAFETLGVEFQNSDGSVRDMRSVLDDLADGFARLESDTERVGLAQQIFGTRATAVVNVLSRGRASLRAQTEEMRELGVVSDEGARTLKALAQDFTDLANVVRTNFANAVAASAVSVRDLIGRVTTVAVDVLPTLTSVGLAAATALTRVADSFLLLGGAIAAIKLAPFITSMATIVGSIPGVAAGITGVSQAIATWIGPAGWIALAAAGLFTFREEIRELVFGLDAMEKAADKVNRVLSIGGATTFETLENARREVRELTKDERELQTAIEELVETQSQGNRIQGQARIRYNELRAELEAVQTRLVQAHERLAEATTAQVEHEQAQARSRDAIASTTQAISDQTTAVDRQQEFLETVTRLQREATQQTNQLREAIGTSLPESLQTAADRAESLNRSFIDAAGTVAGIEHDIALAGSATEQLAARASAISGIERQNAVLAGRINAARRAGNLELVEQLESLREVNDYQLRRLMLSEQQLAILKEMAAEEQQAATQSESRWIGFKRIGRDALDTVARSLENLILHSDNFADSLKRLAVLLAATAIRAALFSALGIEDTRHEGGRVQAGRIYQTIPGEAFIPAVDGAVIPRRELRMASGGPSFAPVFNINATAESAPLVRAEIERAFPRIVRLWEQQQDRRLARTRELR